MAFALLTYFARKTIGPPERVDLVVCFAKLRSMNAEHTTRVFWSAQASLMLLCA